MYVIVSILCCVLWVCSLSYQYIVSAPDWKRSALGLVWVWDRDYSVHTPIISMDKYAHSSSYIRDAWGVAGGPHSTANQKVACSNPTIAIGDIFFLS